MDVSCAVGADIRGEALYSVGPAKSPEPAWIL